MARHKLTIVQCCIIHLEGLHNHFVAQLRPEWADGTARHAFHLSVARPSSTDEQISSGSCYHSFAVEGVPVWLGVIESRLNHSS